MPEQNYKLRTMHIQNINFEMRFHGEGWADCIVTIGSSEQRENEMIQTIPEQYINTVMPVVIAGIAGICRQFQGHPGCDIESVIERFGPTLEHTYHEMVQRTEMRKEPHPNQN